MINYTERLTLLMQDVVSRVPTLSFIDIARRARVRARRPLERRRRVRDLPLPDAAGERAGLLLLARSLDAARSRAARSGSSPSRRSSRVGARDIKYMISFALPRFCDQSLDRRARSGSIPAPSRGSRSSTRSCTSSITSIPSWPASAASRRKTAPTRPTATASSSSSRWPTWCTTYLDSEPIAGGLRFPARTTSTRSTRSYGGVVGTSFRTFPSFPQRYIERARGAAAVRGGRRRREGRAAARAAAADALHAKTISTSASS